MYLVPLQLLNQQPLRGSSFRRQVQHAKVILIATLSRLELRVSVMPMLLFRDLLREHANPPESKFRFTYVDPYVYMNHLRLKIKKRIELISLVSERIVR